MVELGGITQPMRPEKYRERYVHSGPKGGPISAQLRIVEDEDWYGNRDQIKAAEAAAAAREAERARLKSS